jgi:hypothetical protein
MLTVTPTTVYAATKLATPQFSVKYVNHPYDIPPTTSTHPYTGEVTNTPGYRIDNWTLEVTIKNQPFTSYTDKDGTEFNLYYNVEFKGHYEDYWRNFDTEIMQSKSGNTVVSSSKYYSPGYQLDFRVMAIVGYLYNAMAGRPITPMYTLAWAKTSDYSITQTFTIPDIHSPSTSPSQTTTPPPPSATFEENQTQIPNQPQQPFFVFTNPIWLLVTVVLFAGVIVGVVMVCLRHHLKTSDFNNNFSQTNQPTKNTINYREMQLKKKFL